MPTIARIETIDVDGYLRIHTGKAPGARVRVIIEDLDDLPSASPLTEDESSQWAVYSAVTVEDAEEDALWGSLPFSVESFIG